MFSLDINLMSIFRYAFLLTSPAVALYLVSYFVIIKRPALRTHTQVQADAEEKEPILGDSTSIQGNSTCVKDMQATSIHEL